MAEAGLKHYSGEAGKIYHSSKRAIPAPAFPWVARLRAEKIQFHIRPSDIVFEYGLGFGWNLAALNCSRKMGSDAAEFLETGVQSRGIEFIRNPQTLAPASIDVVICHHTLEHVINPASTLAEMGQWLRPGGKLLLFVPFEKERRYRSFDPHEPNHHLFSWNVQTLANLVVEQGYRVVEAGIGPFGYDRFASAWACKLHGGENTFRFIRGLAHALRPAKEVRLVAVKD